jgi:hypothetical protein
MYYVFFVFLGILLTIVFFHRIVLPRTMVYDNTDLTKIISDAINSELANLSTAYVTDLPYI